MTATEDIRKLAMKMLYKSMAIIASTGKQISVEDINELNAYKDAINYYPDTEAEKWIRIASKLYRELKGGLEKNRDQYTHEILQEYESAIKQV